MQPLAENEALQKDILSLALVGDGAWSLFIRDKLIREFDCKSGELSKRSINFVSAAAQCRLLYILDDKLTEIEKSIAKRARNASHLTKAKNASIIEYKKATAFEAVLGFLHLVGQTERLNELMEYCYEKAKQRS